ncbi:phosphopantothenate/pantothenate synthetase [Candidatus Woesearchaeota archaeon]|nr:phosphopantothenate/pantothenate synthetase [Candidatus Woesearchaeota archaeon]
MKIPKSHPRYNSLMTREKIVEGAKKGITSLEGLIAQGRGEAFDYLIGEKTSKPAQKAIDAAASLLLLAKNPVISVNGNAAALAPKELVRLSKSIPAKLEVNIFYASNQREIKIKSHLIKNGAKEVLMPEKNATIKYLESNRKHVNKNGIMKADVVFVPLEDGDRAEALIKNKKKVITIDLNPLSRTAQRATITIVDNITRAVPLLIKKVNQYKKFDKGNLRKIIRGYDNKKTLREANKIIAKYTPKPPSSPSSL